jgi:hypothetical protein
MKKFALLSLLCLGLTACEDEPNIEYLPAPTVEAGDCEYKKTGLTEAAAKTEMDRVAGILANSSIGTHAIEVKTQTYISATKDGVPSAYGFQITFSCGDAAIKYETSAEYDYNSDATKALNNRLAVLNAARYIKKIGSGINSHSYEECDECSETVCDICEDEEGEYECDCSTEYYDCNCDTWYTYSYWIEYAQVTPTRGTDTTQVSVLQSQDLTARRNSALDAEVEKVFAKLLEHPKPARVKKECKRLQRKRSAGWKPTKKVSTTVPNKRNLYFILNEK